MGKIVNCLIFIVFLILFLFCHHNDPAGYFRKMVILQKHKNKQMMKQMNFSPDNTFPKE